MQTGSNKKNIEIAIAVMGWLSVILQFVLIIINRVAPVPETIVRFFSYYTILTNILVAAAFTSFTGAFGEKWKQFFLKATSFTSVTVYITVVCITYNLVLRGLVELTGLQILVDEMLHLIIPIFVLLYWFIVFSSSPLQWRDAFNWMWYPLIYCIYVLIRGAFSGFYPYPFMNVKEFGYSSVFINCVYVTVAFFVVALLLIGFSKLRMKKQLPV